MQDNVKVLDAELAGLEPNHQVFHHHSVVTAPNIFVVRKKSSTKRVVATREKLVH